jgi:hypothetical protein
MLSMDSYITRLEGVRWHMGVAHGRQKMMHANKL